jgi:Hemerythrin HHE cation binding domain
MEETIMVTATQKIASQVMGGMKATKATLEGLTGVFRKLAQEHGEVTALLLRVKASADPKLRAELFPVIRKELLGHERGETEVVYAALEIPAETQAIVAQHRQEAVELEKLLDQLTTLDYADEMWATTFAAMVDTVQRHVAEEEGEFFPAGQRVLGSDVAEQLQARYEDVKASFTLA